MPIPYAHHIKPYSTKRTPDQEHENGAPQRTPEGNAPRLSTMLLKVPLVSGEGVLQGGSRMTGQKKVPDAGPRICHSRVCQDGHRTEHL